MIERLYKLGKINLGIKNLKSVKIIIKSVTFVLVLINI